MKNGRIVVVGGSSPIGLEIVRRLRVAGADVIATYRTDKPAALNMLREVGARPAYLDLDELNGDHLVLQNADGFILTPILSASVRFLPHIPPGARVALFSSNNVAIDQTAEIYGQLRAAEHLVAEKRPDAVIIRPTMIYGHAEDGNCARLMGFMQRYHIAPVIGSGGALQQPIYYSDLAKIAIDLLHDKSAYGVIAAAGPESVSQNDLYHAIAEAGHVSPFHFNVPISGISAGMRLISALGLKPPLSAAQIERVGLDKTPVCDRIVCGETPLFTGLKALAKALDERP